MSEKGFSTTLKPPLKLPAQSQSKTILKNSFWSSDALMIWLIFLLKAKEPECFGRQQLFHGCRRHLTLHSCAAVESAASKGPPNARVNGFQPYSRGFPERSRHVRVATFRFCRNPAAGGESTALCRMKDEAVNGWRMKRWFHDLELGQFISSSSPFFLLLCSPSLHHLLSARAKQVAEGVESMREVGEEEKKMEWGRRCERSWGERRRRRLGRFVSEGCDFL